MKLLKLFDVNYLFLLKYIGGTLFVLPIVLNKLHINNMNIIDKKLYSSKTLLGKRILIERNTKTDKIYYIMKLTNSQEENYNIQYFTERQYYFCIPTDNRTKCYCYNGNLPITIGWEDKVYQISENEYLDLFRKFVKYDGNDKYNIDLEI